MQKVKLFETHKELMRIKKLDIDRALNMFNQTQRVYQDVIQTIMSELGIPKKGLKKWRLSSNGVHFERIVEEKKKATLTPVKKREKEKKKK